MQIARRKIGPSEPPPPIPRQLGSLVVLLPAVPHHRQLPQVRHSPSPSGFGTANPRPLQLLSSIQELMYFYMRPDHTSFQASTSLRSAQSATHTIDPQKIKNHKDRVSIHIPGSTTAAHVLSNSYHLRIIMIRTSFASAADAVLTTTSTPVQKASTPSLSSRSAVSSANQVGRLATRVCAEKREQTSTSQPARKARDGAYWVCSCTTKLMIASPTRP